MVWGFLGFPQGTAGLSCADIVDGGDESEQEEPSFTGGLVLGTLVATKVLFDLGLWVPQACSGVTDIKNYVYAYLYMYVCMYMYRKGYSSTTGMMRKRFACKHLDVRKFVVA